MVRQLEVLPGIPLKPRVVGAIAPSSAALAHRMVEWLEFERASSIIECGPGTGVFTQTILPKLPPHARFFMIEVNPTFVRILRERFPDQRIYQESVFNVRHLCEQQGIGGVDCIVSGLPWASFSQEMQDDYLRGIQTVLRPRGQFVTFAYLQGLLLPAGRRFQQKLKDFFTHISWSRPVWNNLPPALVYRCRK